MPPKNVIQIKINPTADQLAAIDKAAAEDGYNSRSEYILMIVGMYISGRLPDGEEFPRGNQWGGKRDRAEDESEE